MFQNKKSFGQNFLSDKNIVKKIVAAAEVKAGDLVLEIGPGQGILTEALLDVGAQVIAVELDKDLIEPLKEKFGDKINLLQGDILATNTWKMIRNCIVDRQPYSVVANIPYNITSPILETLFKAEPRPTSMTLMVQREVADRILAEPPKTSVLSVACQLYATGKKALQVPRGAFQPTPKVDSTVIRLVLRSNWLGNIDQEEILKLVKAGFAARRKQLHGNLVKAGFGSQEKIKGHLKSLGLSEKARAENLTVEQWVELFVGLEGTRSIKGTRGTKGFGGL
ncbi:MAG: 16S rRNA (adenine(1518)-N(6)/adenine(1519)-N(6))-dimethyltransferase RsmA [Candidatus Uhrbacteria bacterium]